MTTLKVQKRDMETKAKKLRREGFITGNLFGKEIEGSIPLKIERLEAERTLRGCMKGTQIMLDVEGKMYDVLIKDVEFNPLAGKVDEIDFDATKNQTLEIDFQALVSNEKVHSVAEIVLHNTENVVEGVLEQILKEVSYKAYPSALVDKIDVDCGNLHLGDCIRVKDLEIAKNKDISIMTNPESIIVNVIAVHNNAGDDTADDTEETAEK